MAHPGAHVVYVVGFKALARRYARFDVGAAAREPWALGMNPSGGCWPIPTRRAQFMLARSYACRPVCRRLRSTETGDRGRNQCPILSTDRFGYTDCRNFPLARAVRAPFAPASELSSWMPVVGRSFRKGPSLYCSFRFVRSSCRMNSARASRPRDRWSQLQINKLSPSRRPKGERHWSFFSCSVTTNAISPARAKRRTSVPSSNNSGI